MLSIKIKDTALLHNLIFNENAFDRFLLREASITTCTTLQLDGTLQAAFYKNQNGEQLQPVNDYQTWEVLRPICSEFVKGDTFPLAYKIILLTDKKSTAALCQRSGFSDCNVTSLSMNILYKTDGLFMSSGIAYDGFTMDKSIERLWEQSIKSFLDKKGCTYEE